MSLLLPKTNAQIQRWRDPDNEGLVRFIEHVQEEINDVRYELYGPEGFDSDYKKNLKDDGLWEEELARWEAPTPEKAAELEDVLSCRAWAIRSATIIVEKPRRRRY